MVLKLSLAVILTGDPGERAGANPPPPQQPIRVESREVHRPVTVRTEKGAFVTVSSKKTSRFSTKASPRPSPISQASRISRWSSDSSST
jgi:hypothetical protein